MIRIKVRGLAGCLLKIVFVLYLLDVNGALRFSAPPLSSKLVSLQDSAVKSVKKVGMFIPILRDSSTVNVYPSPADGSVQKTNETFVKRKWFSIIGKARFGKLIATFFAGVNIYPCRAAESIQKATETPASKVAMNLPKLTMPRTGNPLRSPNHHHQGHTRSGAHFVRHAVRNVGPSVVRIDCEREISQFAHLFSDFSGNEAPSIIKVAGTGIVVNKEGLILTNAHVVEQAKKLTITLSTGRSFKASVVAFDEFTDLAVIKADISKEKGDFSLVQAPLGDSSSLHAGDWVIAVGCPVGLDFTVTLGVVSSPRRSAMEVGAPHLKGSYIQTDAALNSGNSGGPLVNDQGEVIGINTMVRTNTEAIGFAIPINRAQQIYEVLRQGKKPSHAYFGLEITSITPDNAKINNEDPNAQRIPEIIGALVLKVTPGSPAEAAGLRKMDVITKVNGHVIKNGDDAESHLDGCKPEKVSTITVARGENSVVMEVSATPQDLFKLLEEKKKQLQSSVVVIKPSH